MSYKHKEHIRDIRHSFGLTKIPDADVESVQDELDEVYEKAERFDGLERLKEIDNQVFMQSNAFDELLNIYEQYKDSPTHDLKAVLGTKVIEIMEEHVE